MIVIGLAEMFEEEQLDARLQKAKDELKQHNSEPWLLMETNTVL